MNAADIAILAVLALSTLLGLWRGFVMEAFSLLRWIAAFWVAWAFGDRVAAFYGQWLHDPSGRIIAGYATCFVGVLIVGTLLGLLVRGLARGLHLGGGDHFLGMLFGLARGLLLVTFVVLMLGFTMVPHDAAWWRQSRLLPRFEDGAAWVAPALPPDVSRYLTAGGHALPTLGESRASSSAPAGAVLPAVPGEKDLPALPTISISAMRRALDLASPPASARSASSPASSTGRARAHAPERDDVGQ